MMKLLERVYLVSSGQVGLSDPGDCYVHLFGTPQPGGYFNTQYESDEWQQMGW